MFVLEALEMGEGEVEGLLSWDCVVRSCQGFFESPAKLCSPPCTSSNSKSCSHQVTPAESRMHRDPLGSPPYFSSLQTLKSSPVSPSQMIYQAVNEFCNQPVRLLSVNHF